MWSLTFEKNDSIRNSAASRSGRTCVGFLSVLIEPSRSLDRCGSLVKSDGPKVFSTNRRIVSRYDNDAESPRYTAKKISILSSILYDADDDGTRAKYLSLRYALYQTSSLAQASGHSRARRFSGEEACSALGNFTPKNKRKRPLTQPPLPVI